MNNEALKQALEAAYLAGFNASGEGYNGEYPFGDHARNPAQDEGWCQNRDAYIRKALAEQPAPMIRGDIRDGLVDDEPAQSSKPWVGLTRAERFEIEKAMSKYYDYQHECKTVCLPEFARAIEAKLKEKNT